MARLSDEQIKDIKQSVSLVKLAKKQGFTLTKEGKDYVLCCPFHDEDTPSCKITPSKNLFHCFGCGAAGSPIDWMQQLERVSFRKACDLLLVEMGLVAELPAPRKWSQPNTGNRPDDTHELTFSDAPSALTQVIAYYHETLKTSTEALDYLASRGLKNDDLINTFKLGFANRTLGYRLPCIDRKIGKEARAILRNAGLIRKSGHEHFNGSLVVPFIDDDNAIVEVYGRKVTRDTKLTKGTPLHLYLPGPHAGVFNGAALNNHSPLILCESVIDAMTFWVHGFKNVTASFGASGFTEEMKAQLLQLKINKVIIAYDRDQAGDKGSERVKDELAPLGFEIFRVEWPYDMDVNQYALESDNPQAALAEALRHAVWLAGSKKQNVHVPSLENDDLLAVLENTETHAQEPVFAESCQTQALVAESELVEARGTTAELFIKRDDRDYRVRGLDKNTGFDILKINLLVKQDSHVHMDTLDIYHARQRMSFIKQASVELGVSQDVIKADLAAVVLKCESLQSQSIQKTLATLDNDDGVDMTDEARNAAFELLQDPKLIERIVADINAGGLVGEDDNALVAYLAATSRLLPKPLAILIQSTSAAGKSSVMDAVLKLMPEEQSQQYSAMTGQSLYYMGDTNLKHKILAISEEEGAMNASYALKLLQSEGKVTIASTGKNAATGALETQEHTVEGPVMLFITTTMEPDEELKNRCLVLSVNESRGQTQAIHAAQRMHAELHGLSVGIASVAARELHQNAQRLLMPLAVVNPYASQLTFASHKTRTRRDHMKYLTLIQSVALLHQYQRKTYYATVNGQTVPYINVEKNDIALANRLAEHTLRHTLDEMPVQTRKLLNLVSELVNKACSNLGIAVKDYHFTRKAIRQYTGWSDSQLKTHCARLVDLEYLAIKRGGNGFAHYYELVIDESETDTPLNLLPISELKNPPYDANPSRPSTPSLGVSSTDKISETRVDKGLDGEVVWVTQNETPGDSKNGHCTPEAEENAVVLRKKQGHGHG